MRSPFSHLHIDVESQPTSAASCRCDNFAFFRCWRRRGPNRFDRVGAATKSGHGTTTIISRGQYDKRRHQHYRFFEVHDEFPECGRTYYSSSCSTHKGPDTSPSSSSAEKLSMNNRLSPVSYQNRQVRPEPGARRVSPGDDEQKVWCRDTQR